MKKISMFAMAVLLSFSVQSKAEEVKIGILLSFTGPIEELVAPMAAGAEFAVAEVSDSGLFLGGSTVTPVRGDATCIDAGAATAAAERLVTVDKVSAIMGSDCSGTTGAVLQNVALPNGIVMISPASTSPGFTTVEDDGLFFRTAPSDARQGELMAEIITERGFGSAAVTFINNDYGKGLADSFAAAFEGMGGEITINAPHEVGKADYSAEVAALAAAGGDLMVVAGYIGEGGKSIVRGSIDAGSFDTFVFPDGMYGDGLLDDFGNELDGSFGQAPGTDSPGLATFTELVSSAGINGEGPFIGESYDAAALILLAMQAAGSSESSMLKEKVMDVANAPGEKIYPGELAKALEILANGGEIDYVGASSVELIGPGESAGNYREFEVQNGAWATVAFR
ncbi:MAG: ABC transporter substrate-binding protein [Rhodobacteraceae bacterium]|nr:ABC transporter substrate-binding protein [Paracoccaceae bacterium]